MDILKLFICVFVTSFFCYLQIRQFKGLVNKINKLEQDVEHYRQITLKANGDMQTVKQELVGLCNWLVVAYKGEGDTK